MNTLLIIIYCAGLFTAGVFTGIHIEAQYQVKLRSKIRAMHGPNIEEAMYKDGWRI
jgi:hypothetical protein